MAYRSYKLDAEQRSDPGVLAEVQTISEQGLVSTRPSQRRLIESACGHIMLSAYFTEVMLYSVTHATRLKG